MMQAEENRITSDTFRWFQTHSESRSRVAVVTEGAQPLGLEIARQIGRTGCHVILTDSRPDAGSATVQRLLFEGVSATYRYLDLDSERSLDSFVDDMRAVYGRVDALVHHHGPRFRRRPTDAHDDLLTSDPKLFADVVGRAVHRMVGLSRAMLPVLRGRGVGRIVHVIPDHHEQLVGQSSLWPDGCATSTVASVLVRRMGSEMGQKGVMVNAVALASPQVRRQDRPSEWLIRRCAERVVGLATQAAAPQGKIFYSG